MKMNDGPAGMSAPRDAMRSIASSGRSMTFSAVHQLRKPGGSSSEHWKSA